MQLKYGVNKKIEPLTSDSLELGHRSQRVLRGTVGTISTPQRHYFTLPTFEQQGYGTDLDKAADVSHHPVLKQFPTRFVRDGGPGTSESSC